MTRSDHTDLNSEWRREDVAHGLVASITGCPNALRALGVISWARNGNLLQFA
jgi:hypothetical protein